MSEPTGYILRLSAERAGLFLSPDSFSTGASQDRSDLPEFAEPVSEFEHSRSVPLVCFVITDADHVTHYARAVRGQIAGTHLRRLNLFDVTQLGRTFTIEDALRLSQGRSSISIEQRLEAGGLLSPKAFQAFLNAVMELSPADAERLGRFTATRRERIESLSPRVRQNLAEQKEAIATALEAAGIERHELTDWDVNFTAPPTSFLDGLRQLRLREDAMIQNDMVVFPGHELVKAAPFAVFENEHSRLTVVVANRLPLEELTGTDLIYYNETFSSFLMVQYKAMEQRHGERPSFRLPDSQLAEEIRRMERLNAALKDCAPNQHADGFRLHENPFFLKLCSRLRFNPDDSSLTPGMYLPLDYWKLLDLDPRIEGPKGGRAVSYETARRYFDNTEFTRLAANAWIGTTINQSLVLEDAIRETLESGHAAVIAIRQGDVPPRRW